MRDERFFIGCHTTLSCGDSFHMSYINSPALSVNALKLNANISNREPSLQKICDVPQGISASIRDKIGGRDRRALEAVVVACLLWFWGVNPDQKPVMSLLLASAVLILAIFPLWHWLGQSQRDAIPVLAFHGFFYAVCFGLAGFINPSGTIAGLLVNERELQQGLVCAMLGLLSLYLSYYKIAPRLLSEKVRLSWPFVFKESAYGRVALFLYPAVFLISSLIAREKLSLFSQYSGAISTFLFMLLLHAHLSGKLMGKARFLFAYVMLPVNLLFFSGLTNSQIAGFVMLIVCISIVYVATKRKAPYKWLILAAGVFFLLQPIKGEFRNMVWTDKVAMSPVEKLQTFFDLGVNYYFGNGVKTSSEENGLKTAFERINHLHVTALIIADTSADDSFLYGKSYVPLLTKWIPRFLWPGKPIEDFGNVWAHRYGYLASNDYSTSFNLPWLPEMYMNFGMAGVIGVSFLLGMVFRFLRNSFWQSSSDSTLFAFGLTLGGPLMFVESNLSMILGGVIITIATLFALMLLLSWFFPGMAEKRLKSS